MPTSGGMLHQVQDDLVQEAMASLGPEWDAMPVAARQMEARRRLEIMEDIDRTSDFALKQHQDKVEDLETMQNEIVANRYFDLSKVAQLTEPDSGPLLPEQGLRFADACDIKDYLDAQSDIDSVIAEFMSLASDDPILNQDGVAVNPRQVINDEVKSFMEGKETLASNDKLKIAINIYDVLPQAAKSEEDPVHRGTEIPSVRKHVSSSDLDIVEALGRDPVSTARSISYHWKRDGKWEHFKEIANVDFDHFMKNSGILGAFGLHDAYKVGQEVYKIMMTELYHQKSPEEFVNASNSALREAAISLVKKSRTSREVFNLNKFAQHKGMENNIMFGPDQTRIDPFTGELISNWHVYERNKGFGFKLDDALDIDYEAIWRGSVMDKYTAPYRNKDGEWIGGYVERRFEVDKWQPEENNLQLRPGQKRKPYLPEYRSTEARLQNMRSKGSDSRGREWANTEKPFDWNSEGTSSGTFNLKKAESKKKRQLTRKADGLGDFFAETKNTLLI